MTPLKNWFKRLFSGDRRRAERRPGTGLVAHYFTGAAPAATGVQDISATGLYLLTEERWYPGTVVKITLQRTDPTGEGPERSIAVQSEAVRCGMDGVGFTFVLPDTDDSNRSKHRLDVVANKESLIKFLQQIIAKSG
jgi:hypothetical protein